MYKKPVPNKQYIVSILGITLFYFLINPKPILAYGGGGVFPPAFDLHNRFKIECSIVTMKLPFNRTQSFPMCVLKKNTPPAQDIKTRVSDFLKRVETGGQ